MQQVVTYPATQPLPGFTVEQTASLQACISAQLAASNQALMVEMNKLTDNMNAFNAALCKQFGLQPPVPTKPLQLQPPVQTQQSTPPAPQAQKEEEEEKPQSLYQATVEDAEDDPESITESTTGSKSRDSKQLSRKCTPHTGLLATFLATSYLTSFGCFLASFSASHVGYIRCMEEMEASGEG
ncbi:hypothetical protein BDR22DRAFT_894509 [Usnea florida]